MSPLFGRKTKNAKSSLYRLCQVCENLCKVSRLLNDRDYCREVRAAGEKELKGGSEATPTHGFFTASIPDCNQWNENNTFLFEDEIPHHASGAAWCSSAGNGCHLCSLLWNYASTERHGILAQEVDWELEKRADAARGTARQQFLATNDQLYARVGIQIGSEGGYLALVLYVGQQNGQLPDLRSALSIWRTKGVTGVTGIPLEEVKSKLPAECDSMFEPSTASDATIRLIQEWLKLCKGKKHFLCKGNSSTDELTDLPRRLIHVQHAKPRLYLTKPTDTAQKLRYLCLSHCWGQGVVFKLTRDTEAQLRSGIDIKLLPKTFQDAIDIAQRLGYNYIWIDSLCILQDDSADWRVEAIKMASIYTNADATIAALASEDGRGGCYSDQRNMQTYWPCILPTGLELTAWHGRVWPFHNERLGTAPLLRRGWVQQERCFGVRTIYFGKFGVYWECATIRADEVHPAGFAEDSLGPTGQDLQHGEIMAKSLVNRRLYLVGADGIGFPSYLKHDSAVPVRIFLKFVAYWYQIIERYTHAQLTYASDKLIAISGIVELVRRRTGLTSFAGLWLEYLLDDMLWKTVLPDKVSRPAEYLAPSFSWASLTGAVERKLSLFGCSNTSGYGENVWDPHNYESGWTREYVAELVHHDIVAADPSRSTSGQVRSASIELLCHALTVTTTHLKPSQSPFANIWTHPYATPLAAAHHRVSSDPSAAAAAAGASATSTSAKLDDLKPEHRISNRWFALDCAADATPRMLTVTCVPLVKWDRAEGHHIAGIVLVPSPGKPRTYRRIGMFEDCWDGQERWTDGERERITIV